MDTIIYFYYDRRATDFVTEKWREEDYCLIRAGIPPSVRRGLRRTAEGREADRADRELWQELRTWQRALYLLSEDENRTACVCEKGINIHLPAPLFTDYHEPKWVDKLLPQAVCDGFLILGYADCLPEILWENAGRLRQVEWMLPGERYDAWLQEFLDGFYEETGLCVNVRLIESAQDGRYAGLRSDVPVSVLDFTGEEKISAGGLAPGSIWLDMDSMDGKRERMEARSPQITYFSLKKLWKQRQKEAYTLTL